MRSEKSVLDVHDLARIFNCSAEKIKRMARRGELPAFKFGKIWYVRPNDLGGGGPTPANFTRKGAASKPLWSQVRLGKSLENALDMYSRPAADSREAAGQPGVAVEKLFRGIFQRRICL